MALFENLRADIARHMRGDEALGERLVRIVESQGIWAVAVYRFGRWVYTEAPAPARGPLKLAYKIANKAVEVTTGIVLPASCDIGPGLLISHPGTIILHPHTRIGRDCSIGQDTTVGTTGRGGEGAPVLGDDVYLGSGCRVLGPVHVGDGASVGANAVVLRDVPPHHTAVGVPAQIMPRRSVTPGIEPVPPNGSARSTSGS